jgi:iron(III) transport system substrate-binding protein
MNHWQVDAFMMSDGRTRFSLVVALVLCSGLPALAQAGASTTAEIADYTGPDRTERLVAGAKREGAFTIYTSARVDDMALLGAAFEKKYGVKARVWRASSENVLQRGAMEARGGRFDADVFESNAGAMEALHRENLLQKLPVPNSADLYPAAILSHGEWTGTRINLFVAAYNTPMVKPDERPKSYDDLADPKWKGRLGIEAEDTDWFGTVIAQLGEERGLKLFHTIVANNGISVRKGHTLLSNLVVSGEVPLAITTYSFTDEQLKKSGAPIEWIAIPPAIARFEGVGVTRKAPHPHAAILFYEFLLTEGQKILGSREIITASRSERPLPAGLSVVFVDAAKALDENPKWSKSYRDIFTNQAR